MKQARTRMGRGRWVRRVMLWVGLVVFSALAGMMVHELGHVAMARAAGLQIAEVVWGPVGSGELSRTFLMDSPRPAMVVWSGFAMGAALPVLVWGLTELVRWKWACLWRFFAGFCLVGNGAYLAAGWVERTADGGELVQAGVPVWVMVMTGGLLVTAGLGTWHGSARKLKECGWAAVACVWIAVATICMLEWGLNR